MKTILAVGALYEELEPLIKRWKLAPEKNTAGMWIKATPSLQMKAVVTGVGRNKCRKFLSELDSLNADYLFVIGTAGGCYPECKPGDFVLPRLTFENESERPVLYEPPVELYPEPLMTGSHFTADTFQPGKEKEKLYEEKGIYTVDMEWSVVLEYARKQHIPVFYCKVIADAPHMADLPLGLMNFYWRNLPWKKMLVSVKTSPGSKMRQYYHALKFSRHLRKASLKSVILLEKICKRLI